MGPDADIMLFNSHPYIFLFLPITILVYFLLKKGLVSGGALALIAASIVFYGWHHPAYVALLGGSICFNFIVALSITNLESKEKGPLRLALVVFGIAGNVLVLGYFKYADFFIMNLNALAGLKIPLLHILLPAGVSFFTLNQIGYLVDTWKGRITEHNLLSYAQFVSFFPSILAGPILRYDEVAPQLARSENTFNYRNACEGILLFFVGLFKKTVIADSLAVWANNGFDAAVTLTFAEAWITSLSYTLELYFDFSGYTDMALGSALFFNVRLPFNFDSPYRSLNIQEFWRKWHMTLGRFMRDYVYIPLGGSRVSESRILANLMITFGIIGVWHGAGWTFILWGCMHGVAMIIHRLWRRLHIEVPGPIAWLITFNFVNGAWVFFRAKNLDDATKVLKGMTGLSGFVLPKSMEPMTGILSAQGMRFGNLLAGISGNELTFLAVFVFLLAAVLFKNSNRMVQDFEPDLARLCVLVTLAVVTILYLGKYSEFLYFRF